MEQRKLSESSMTKPSTDPLIFNEDPSISVKINQALSSTNQHAIYSHQHSSEKSSVLRISNPNLSYDQPATGYNKNDSYMSSLGEDSSGFESPRTSNLSQDGQQQASIFKNSIPELQRITAKMQAPGSFQNCQPFVIEHETIEIGNKFTRRKPNEPQSIQFQTSRQKLRNKYSDPSEETKERKLKLSFEGVLSSEDTEFVQRQELHQIGRPQNQRPQISTQGSGYRIEVASQEQNDSDLSMQDISNSSQTEILKFHLHQNLRLTQTFGIQDLKMQPQRQAQHASSQTFQGLTRVRDIFTDPDQSLSERQISKPLNQIEEKKQTRQPNKQLKVSNGFPQTKQVHTQPSQSMYQQMLKSDSFPQQPEEQNSPTFSVKDIWIQKGDTPPPESQLGADVPDLSPDSQKSSKQGVNALRNPIKNIRRENSLPPETTDLSFDEAETFKSFIETKNDAQALVSNHRVDQMQANLNDSFSTCEIKVSTFNQQEQPDNSYFMRRHPNQDKKINSERAKRQMHTEEHEAPEDDAIYEIGVTEESFTLQARGAFGNANELIPSARHQNYQNDESSVQSLVGMQESPLESQGRQSIHNNENEEIKEDEITQMMTGQHRQIQIQQNPLVHQAAASQFAAPQFNRTATIIQGIQRDFQVLDDSQSIRSDLTVNIPGAAPNYSPISPSEAPQMPQSAFVPVHTTYTAYAQQQSNQRQQSDRQQLQRDQLPRSLNQNVLGPDQQQMISFFQQRDGVPIQKLLEEFMIGFQYLFNAEKTMLKHERDHLTTEKSKFAQERKNQYEELKADKQRWHENKDKVEKMFSRQEDIVDLNIGGTHKVTTSRRTLTSVKDSSLAAMFSGRYPLTKHNGRVFIDRDGEAFCQMLSFLRTGKVPLFSSQVQEHSFYDELDFWMVPSQHSQMGNAFQSIGFTGLQVDVGEMNTKKQTFDPEWCADTLQLTDNNLVLKKQGNKHGIVFCSTPLDIFTSYVEFNVQIDTIFGGKSHLFVGMVDITNQRPENLTSTFWKDSPSSIYWDIWSLKLVSIDANGQQSGTVFGYGCKCEDKVTKIGIFYDARSRCVSFFKNGVNQGVAFTNIPTGMRPSLDVWFQTGQIEISTAKIPGQKKPLKCNF